MPEKRCVQRIGRGCGADVVGDLARVRRIIFRNLSGQRVGRPRCVQATDAKVETAQAIEVIGPNHSSDPPPVTDDHSQTARHRLDRAFRLGEGEVIARQQRFGIAHRIAGKEADVIEIDSVTTAGLFHEREMRPLVGGVAEQDGAPRSLRKGRPLAEATGVDRVEQHRHVLRRDSFFGEQEIGARVVDGDVTENPREVRYQGRPTMADEERGRFREVQQCRHRLGGAVAVNDVGRRADRGEVARHRHGEPVELPCRFAEHRAIDDRRVSAVEQPRREIALVGLNAADDAEGVAGDQDTNWPLSILAHSASRSGIMCSPRRITCS